MNGRYVGRGPGPCDAEFQYYDSCDLGQFLRPGKNVIAALCYNYGVDAYSRPARPGGFLLQAEIEDSDGAPLVIATDETWRVKPADDWDFNSPRMAPGIGFQEVYDSRRKPVGWNVVGFDDSGWDRPEVIGEAASTNLVPREIPALREWSVYPERVVECGWVQPAADAFLDIAERMSIERTEADPRAVLGAKSVLEPYNDTAEIAPCRDSFIVLDFGREIAGFPRLTIRDGSYGIIDIACRGSFDQADRLILHGGMQDWENFGRRVFRYVQLTFRNLHTPVRLECVSAQRIGYPVEPLSSFECSDETLNRAWKTDVESLSVRMQDDYEACPLQGPGADLFDARVLALKNYYSFGDRLLAAKTLRQFARRLSGRTLPDAESGRPAEKLSALDEGVTSGSHDSLLIDASGKPPLGARAAWVMILHDYCLYTGDLALVEELWGSLCAHAEELGAGSGADAFRYQALRDASKLASLLEAG